MHEDAFILNAARISLSEKNISVLKEISKNDMDWELFKKKACIHGVSTFIYYSLTQHGLSGLIPLPVYEQFKNHYYSNAVRNSIFLEEIEKLSNMIENKFVLLKGADLIQNLYPTIAIRSMCDIDILVESKNAKEIWTKLLFSGFQEITQPAKSRIHNISNNSKLRHLPALYSDRCRVEIHWNLFRMNRLCEITKIALNKSLHFNDNKCILTSELMLIHLCSHFYDHLQTVVILRMLCDLNELIQKYGNSLNWEEIKEICIDPALKKEVDTALTYTHRLLKTPIPQDFILKRTIQELSITLDSINVKRDIPKKTGLYYFFSQIYNLRKPIAIFIFIFRTIVPNKIWMKSRYKISTIGELLRAYFKYWIYLFNRHVLQKPVTIEN